MNKALFKIVQNWKWSQWKFFRVTKQIMYKNSVF